MKESLVKMIGGTAVYLSIRAGKGMVHCEGWSTGYRMTTAEAANYFAWLTTIQQLNDAISDAYNSASGQEC